MQDTYINYYAYHWFIHQSGSYTSKNGAGERKRHHLLEIMERNLHVHIPKSSWGDDVLTVCILTNKVPSKSSSKTPF